VKERHLTIAWCAEPVAGI